MDSSHSTLTHTYISRLLDTYQSELGVPLHISYVGDNKSQITQL